MRIGQSVWLIAACVLALAACKKSESNNAGSSGTGAAGMTTGSSGTTGASGTAGGSKMAAATITALGTGPTVTGTATFSEANGMTTLSITINGCMDGKMYASHIHDGAACDNP